MIFHKDTHRFCLQLYSKEAISNHLTQYRISPMKYQSEDRKTSPEPLSRWGWICSDITWLCSSSSLWSWLKSVALTASTWIRGHIFFSGFLAMIPRISPSLNSYYVRIRNALVSLFPLINHWKPNYSEWNPSFQRLAFLNSICYHPAQLLGGTLCSPDLRGTQKKGASDGLGSQEAYCEQRWQVTRNAARSSMQRLPREWDKGQDTPSRSEGRMKKGRGSSSWRTGSTLMSANGGRVCSKKGLGLQKGI